MIHFISHRNSTLILVALAAVFVGCNKGSLPKPQTVPVLGKVTFDGKGVAHATVSFHPTGEQRAAFSQTDADGNYRLSTIGENDGAMPGDYQVVISKIIDENPPPPAEMGSAAPPPLYKSLLPAKYEKPNTSGLTAKVTQEGPNQFDFSLKK